MKVNITMEDGSKLEKVNIFTSRNMGDLVEAQNLLMTKLTRVRLKILIQRSCRHE